MCCFSPHSFPRLTTSCSIHKGFLVFRGSFPRAGDYPYRFDPSRAGRVDHGKPLIHADAFKNREENFRLGRKIGTRRLFTGLAPAVTLLLWARARLLRSAEGTLQRSS